MKHFSTITLFVCTALCISVSGSSQGCCSGGVPIANNIGLAPAAEKSLQLQILYDLNVLHTLKERDNKLNDNSRERKTHSLLLQSGYSFSPKISAELLLTWIRQQRKITQSGFESETNTSGFGDAVLLVKYNLIQTRKINWQAGIGSKFPFGAFDRTNENGLTLNADLQPGTGSFDGILFSQFLSRSPSSSRSLFSSFTLAIKGTNHRYLTDQKYRTGTELLLTAGVSDQFLIGSSLLNASIAGLYRFAGPDRFKESKVPGTGGHWIFLRPSAGVRISPLINLNIMGFIPVYSYVNETQLTPSYRINTGFYLLMNTEKKDLSKKEIL